MFCLLYLPQLNWQNNELKEFKNRLVIRYRYRVKVVQVQQCHKLVFSTTLNVLCLKINDRFILFTSPSFVLIKSINLIVFVDENVSLIVSSASLSFRWFLSEQWRGSKGQFSLCNSRFDEFRPGFLKLGDAATFQCCRGKICQN